MRSAHLFGLFAFAIILAALTGLFRPDGPEPMVAAYAAPRDHIGTTTTTASPITVTTAPEVERELEVDAMRAPVGDLPATTTSTAPPFETAAPSASSGPPPSTTQPKVDNTTTTAPPPPPPPVVQGGPNSELESQFASNINSYRSGSGLAGLTRDGSLDSRARAWSEGLANNGGLSHSNLGSLLPPWSAAAENVAMGGSVDDVFGAVAGSSGHQANMLGDYTHFGVGVWVNPSGTIWTTHIFTR